MRRERLQRWWKTILALYLISFLLPVFDSMRSLGIFAFFLSLLGSSYCPGLLLYWVANPLLWFGVSCMRSGRWGHAAAFGGAACAFAALPLIPIQEWETFRNKAGSLMVGYWAWLASTVLLAAVGLARWLEPKVRP